MLVLYANKVIIFIKKFSAMKSIPLVTSKLNLHITPQINYEYENIMKNARKMKGEESHTHLMSSKISGLFLSLIFILSLMAIMMFWVLSSAPCLELFSAAPEEEEEKTQTCYRSTINVYSLFFLM